MPIGLGEMQKVDSLRIVWPDGYTQLFEDVAVDKHYIIEENNASIKEL
jgi:hypothetical protein